MRSTKTHQLAPLEGSRVFASKRRCALLMSGLLAALRYWQRSLTVAMASGTDDERWARVAGGAAELGEVGQADLPGGEPVDNERSESAASGGESSAPWWAAMAIEWRQQGWTDGEIWTYLLGQDDDQHSEEWWADWSSHDSSWGEATHRRGWWPKGGGHSDPDPEN